ncbi:hypothetical protein E2U45_01245 [Salmonella enterica]|nr:hypothetical protein [Salmonella enterica]EAO2610334.1 hypothetical protein [Salmonella enterica]EAO4135136.1 hypothetical protein [Salmonella enterica]EAQ3158320.1 hypothetical protein [Salmonella enterica]
MKITTVSVCVVCGILPLMILPVLPDTWILASNNHTNCEMAYRMACNRLFYHFMRQPLIMSE